MRCNQGIFLQKMNLESTTKYPGCLMRSDFRINLRLKSSCNCVVIKDDFQGQLRCNQGIFFAKDAIEMPPTYPGCLMRSDFRINLRL